MKKIIVYIFFLFIFIKYSFGENLTKDDLLKMSSNQIIISAKNGDPLAQLWLGDAAYNGSIPNWKSFNVCELYYKSAQQNNAEASLKLYKLLGSRFHDCPKRINFEKSNLNRGFWLLKAARLNNPEAQLKLYYESKNDNTKLRWLKKSVNNNFSPAMTTFARLHLRGNLVKKNIKTAIEFFQKASNADAKNEQPDIELSEIYSNETYLHSKQQYEHKLNSGQIKEMNETTAWILKEYDYSNHFNMNKAVSSAQTCIEKKVSYRCYLLLIQFHSQEIYNNVNYEEALFWLDEAEEALKNDDYYHSVLLTKGVAYLSWDNLKTDKIKAREYFQKAIENYKKSKQFSKRTMTIYEKYLERTY